MEGTDELESRVSFVGKQPMETPQWKPINKNNGGGHLLQMTVKFDRSAGSGDECKSYCRINLGDDKGRPFLESPQLHIGNSGNNFFFAASMDKNNNVLRIFLIHLTLLLPVTLLAELLD